MKTKELDPIRERRGDYDRIEAAILRLLKREIFLPIIAELNGKPALLTNAVVKNSLQDLVDAISSARITYDRGRFTGEFTAQVSKQLRELGAQWDRRESAYKLTIADLPDDVRIAISLSESRFKKVLEKIKRNLDALVPADVAEKLRVAPLFETALWRVDKDFRKSVKMVSVAPQLSKEAAKRIASEYTQNLQLHITDFIDKEILELREKVGTRAYGGLRYEGMIKVIQRSYGVTEKKARFLARQETSLMMTKFKQVRYQDVGINKYRWQCVKMPHQRKGQPYNPGDVRYDHAILDGKIFQWSNPPVVNERGEKKNPGQDYNCRCVARPIVEF